MCIRDSLYTLSQYANNLISICDGVENHVADFNDELKEQIKNLFEAQHYDLIKDDIEELLEESKAGLNRVKDIVDNLKQFSLDSTQGSQVVDLNDVATQTIKLVSTQYASHHYKVESPDEKIEITANPGMIKQALMNILLNAAQAIPDKGYVKLTLLKNNENVTIKVLDSGEGIEQKNMKRVFEPFFTTRPEGQGQGLGLSTAYTLSLIHI